MITWSAKCDYPECKTRGPEAETEVGARDRAYDAGWQRWRAPGDELLDLCPAHHQRVGEPKVQTFRGGE